MEKDKGGAGGVLGFRRIETRATPVLAKPLEQGAGGTDGPDMQRVQNWPTLSSLIIPQTINCFVGLATFAIIPQFVLV